MAKLCGDNTKVALAAFADICNKEAGVKVGMCRPSLSTFCSSRFPMMSCILSQFSR